VIIRVSDLSGAVRYARFRESAGPLNDLIAQTADGTEGCFDGDLDVDAELYRSGDDVYLQGSIVGTVRAECRRCLDEIRWPLRREFRFLLVKDADGTEPEDDAGLGHYSGEEIDLSPLVREQALLALSDVGLCTEDCRGLCPGCGANLNREACKCRK
jgi:uncharacterized protein